MKLSVVLQITSIKVVLHLYQTTSSRYSELLRNLIESRSTLALALRDLQEEGLIERRVKPTRPVQTSYTLTEDGEQVAEHLSAIERLLSQRKTTFNDVDGESAPQIHKG